MWYWNGKGSSVIGLLQEWFDENFMISELVLSHHASFAYPHDKIVEKILLELENEEENSELFKFGKFFLLSQKI